MSHTINLLNEAQSRNHSLQKPVPEHSRANLSWLIGLILGIVLISNLGLTIKLLTMMKTYASTNALQINTFSADFKKMNANLSALSIRTQDSNARITQLEKENDAKSVAIDNLTKAKNTIFKRVSELEANLNEHTRKTNE